VYERHRGTLLNRPARRKLRIILIEDSDDDTDLILRHLREAGYDVTCDRVQTADEMSRALEKNPDCELVISDYSLPTFSAPLALTVLQGCGLDIPFIIVSGTIGEERAVSTMRDGARDFILKHDLSRLTPVIERELQESEARRLRRVAEQTYKASELRYRMIVNTAREGIWLVDARRKTTFANRCLAEMLGFSEQELLGREFQEFLEPGQRDEGTAFFERIKRAGAERADFRLRSREGKSIDALVSAAAKVSDKEGFHGCLLMVTDVTERKEIEKERTRLLDDLRAAVRMRDEFLSIASHELKTPLTSLKLQTQMRQRSVHRGDQTDFSLERLRTMFEGDARHIERLTRLIDDMLDISRISTGKLNLQPEAFDLCDVAKDVVERYRPQFEDARCPVAVQCCDPVRGTWDRFRIEQVIANLLTNAAKYGASKPVLVSISREENLARLMVKDQGIGIARENQERIFQRFERAISANEISGLGLGLYIVKQIVDMHGGSIRVESELNKGSTFIVDLPLTS
jgi:PAS domain S-box-containing protein